MERADQLDLEETAIRAWPAAEEEAIGSWLLRSDHGYTKRANSAYAMGSVDVGDIPQLASWYDGRNLPLIVRELSLHQNAHLGEALLTDGFVRFDETLVMTADLVDLATDAVGVVSIEEWIELYARFEGATKGNQIHHRALIERIQTPVALASSSEGNSPVACGLGVCDGTWLGLFDIATDPNRRRQGHGRQLVAELLDWGYDRGAHRAYLQVLASNEGAIRLYESFGFTEAYRNWYWIKRS
jgi:GNAT superfamily N-acetyltransferase